MAGQEIVVRTIWSKIKPTVLHVSDWCNSVLPSGSFYLEDTSTHDVTFTTSDGGSVSGHRLIVAAGSPVFHAMLCGNMKERNEKEIELPSVPTSLLKTILMFMYTGKIEIDSGNYLDILSAAHYFDVTLLEIRLVEYVTAFINSENCCDVISVANDMNLKLLYDQCCKFMFANAYAFVHTAKFKHLSSEVILMLCKSSELRVSEIHLFAAIAKWHELQNGLSDDTTKSIFQQIRYPLISADELTKKIHPTNLADHKLYMAALRYHENPDNFEGPPYQIATRMKCTDVINVTPDTVSINEASNTILISKTSDDFWDMMLGYDVWDGLCVIQMFAAEEHPVKFKFVVKSCSNLCDVQLAIRSCPLRNISVTSPDGGDLTGFSKGQEYEGLVYVEGKNIIATIGKMKLTAIKRKDPIFFCVHLYIKGIVIQINIV